MSQNIAVGGLVSSSPSPASVSSPSHINENEEYYFSVPEEDELLPLGL